MTRAIGWGIAPASWLAGSVLLCLVVINGWVGDDAAITARTIDNLLHGYGLRWNVAERVQAFTHPLWALLLVPLMGCGLSWYAALIALGFSFTGAAIFGLLRLSRGDALLGVFALTLLGYSRAFLDYSTSGLENPLAACLIVAMVAIVPVAVARDRDVLRVTFLLALLALTRLDLAILGLPACGYTVFVAARSGAGARAILGALIVGMLPLALWEIFSLIYFGFPFPNTAYAKLNTGIDRLRLLHLGLDYFRYTLVHDPWTLIVIPGLVAASIAFHRGPATWALGAGALAYCGYILWIGGDFMAGRFFVAPLVLLVSLVVSQHVALPRKLGLPVLASTLVLGAVLWCVPHLWPVEVQRYGPLDERETYAKTTGFVRVWRGGAGVQHNWLRRGAQWRDEAAGENTPLGEPYLYHHAHAVGMLGLAAGPGVHIVDHLALTEPLLARLPASHDRVIQPGHFERMGQWSSKVPVTVHCPLDYVVCRFWQDYERTLKTGDCALDDAALCQYWRKLTLVARGELFSAARWSAIVELNLGRLEHLIDRRRYRDATLEYPGER